MPGLPLVISSGWASGLNSYAVVLLLGLLGRLDHQSAVPPALERTDVLAVAGVLFVAQFVAGKIPYVDSVWDVVHTPIRVIMAGAIGVLVSNHGHGSLGHAVVTAIVGGGTALLSHGAKTTVRMGINASPEPVSNIAASLGEDGAVAGVIVLALLHPLAAAIISVALLLVTAAVAVLLARSIAAYRRRRRERRAARSAARAAARAAPG